MAVLWLVVLFVVVAGHVGHAGHAGQAQWDSVAVTVPYGEERIAVFRPDKERVPEMFYFMPLVRFIPDSPICFQNVLLGTTRVDLHFNILMWSQESQEVVHQYLKAYLGDDSIQLQQVEPLPMEKIRLGWTDMNRPLDSSSYLLRDDWRAHTDSPTVLRGQITCATAQKCNDLKTLLNTKPESVYALEMEYVVNLQSRRELTLTGSHLKRTNLYSSLSTMPVHSNVRYLTEEAADTLAKQTVAVAFSSVISNSVDARDELTLTNELTNKLKNQQVSAKSFLPGMWPSVFWEHSHSRPDRVAQFLNDVLKPDASDANYFIVLEEKINANDEYKQCARDLGILTSGSTANSFVNRIQKQTVLDAVSSKLRVGTEGDQFLVDDFPLYRLNLASWSSSGSLVSSPVRSRSEAVHSAKVRVQTEKFTSELTPELVQARLQTHIDNRFQTVANVFSAWPEYCRLPSYYCNYKVFLAKLSSVKTQSGCMTECDTNVRCQSFFVSATYGCRLINSICTYGHYRPSSSWDYHVKLSRVPEITAHMWKAIFADGNLGDLPADPCMLLGDHGFVFTQVPRA